MNKSKLISLLLVLAMVLSMVVLPVAAVEETPETPETTETTVATEPAEPTACPVHPEAEWKKVAAADWAAGAALTTGHYFLTENVDLTAALTVAAGETVCIDLAGKNLTQTTAFKTSVSESHRVLEVTGGTLTVIDSVGTGVISGGWTNARAGASNKAFGGNVYLVEGATFNLYGGTISGGIANRHGIGNDATYGGNIYASSAEGAITTVNIFDGTVKDGVASSNYSNTNTNADRDATLHGGNIAVFGGTVLNISGGVITGGKAENNFTAQKSQGKYRATGGNIYIATGSEVTISGGEISNGAAISNNKGITVGTKDTLTAAAYGGNISMVNSTSSLTITGGVIKDGSASATAVPYGDSGVIGSANASARGGNIYAENGVVTVSGGKIQNGTTAATATGTDTDVSRYGGNIYNGNVLNLEGGTISGGEAREGGAIFNSKTLNISGGKLVGGKAVYGAAVYQNEDKTITMTAGVIEGGVAQQGGAIYTKGTVNVSGGEITGGTASAVDKAAADYFKLNNGISTGGNFYISTGNVTISGNAKVTNGCAYYRGGNFYVGGGVLTLKDNAIVAYGHNYFAALADSKGAVNIEATDELPAVSGDVSAEWGGNIYSNATVKMYDNAQVKYGIAARGGNYATATKNGDLYMYGGSIFGGEARRASETSSDVKFYNAAGCTIEMYAGYIQSMKDEGDTNVMKLYGGTLTSTADIVASCEKMHVTGDHYWHADGICDTCGHTFAAPGANAVCPICETVHVTTGGAHTYEDGACTVCGDPEITTHEHNCGCENPEWVLWDGVTLENGGHYYLNGNMQLTQEIKLAENMKVCIDLNGYTLTGAPGKRVVNLPKDTYSTLQLEDGTVQGGGAAVDAVGGLVYVSYNTTFNAYGVIFQNGLTTDANAGGNFYVNGNVFLSSCEVLNGTIDNDNEGRGSDGGNIAIYGATAVVDLLATKVIGGNVQVVNNAYGGNIYSGTDATLIVWDCEISGGCADSGGNIYLMNGADGGYAYFVGDNQVKDAAAESAGRDIQVQGTKDYISNVYIFGGYFEDIYDNGNFNEMLVFSGTFDFDPRTANKDGSSMAADCTCVTFDEATGIYTVNHTGGADCALCDAKAPFAPIVYSNEGAHVYTEGHVCDSCGLVTATIGEVAYTELAAALAAANAESVVVLQKNVNLAALDVYTTLDLNGYTLTAAGVVDASNKDANVIDSVGTGAVAAEEVKFYNENDMLAVLVDGAYKFETVAAKQKMQTLDADSKYLKFIIEDEAADTWLDDILVDGTEFTVRITVTWNDGANVHHFNYNADLVKGYGLDAEGNSVWGKKMFTCTINGLDEIGEHTITAEIVSNGTVVAAVVAG